MIRRIAALATSFNRRELTLLSLASLFAQEGLDEHPLTVFLVDDGSTDGTAETVATHFPQVRLLRGSGSLFWNGGMRKAFETAMREDFDAYLWFNDDSQLFPDALHRVVKITEEALLHGKGAIVTGSMRSKRTGKRSYGGRRRRASGLHVHFDAVEPSLEEPISCDTVNGNFTLISRSVVQELGNLDPVFTHQLGDFDYGLRATKAGFDVLLAPGFCGECEDNSMERTWRDKNASLQQRWKHLMSPKGAPPREWLHYTRRHFGWRWPIYAASPYIKALFGL